jgi:serine/threonine-protein kinase
MPPAMPTVPLDWRDEREEWREHREILREQRKVWRERQKLQRAMGELAPGSLPAPLSMPGAPPAPWANGGQFAMAQALSPVEHRAEAFRRRALGMGALLVFLTFINVVTMAASGAPFPWVFFPAFGIIAGLRRRWRPLAREGLSFWEVMAGGGARAAASRAQAAERIEQRVLRLHRRIKYGVIATAGAVISFILGNEFGLDPMVVPFVAFMAFGVWSLLSAGLNAVRVRRAGIRLHDALSSRWREAIFAADKRPRETIVDEEATRLVGAEVLAGSYGRAVRGAVDDRLMVRETLARLSPADRALIPDVMPTIDGLARRVGELAQSLHRLDGDVSPAQLEAIDARLRALDAEPANAPDRERKRGLLQRQRASVAELIDKRSMLAAQMESAQLVLQNLKLDLIKLRSKGVGAAIGEVSSATQEARVLSRDIANALQAAAEVRGL